MVSRIGRRVGEWGGRMEDAPEVWQRALQAYLRERRMSYFFYALNGNSHSVGGIYPYHYDRGNDILAMLPKTHL